MQVSAQWDMDFLAYVQNNGPPSQKVWLADRAWLL